MGSSPTMEFRRRAPRPARRGMATDYFIGTYVEHDRSTPSPRACGALLASMHAVTPPNNLKCVAEVEDTL